MDRRVTLGVQRRVPVLTTLMKRETSYEQAADHARTALQIHPGHIASLQQLARLELMHPAQPRAASFGTTRPERDPEARAELRTSLSEIAMRGESDAWKDWARLQLVKLDGGR